MEEEIVDEEEELVEEEDDEFRPESDVEQYEESEAAAEEVAEEEEESSLDGDFERPNLILLNSSRDFRLSSSAFAGTRWQSMRCCVTMATYFD